MSDPFLAEIRIFSCTFAPDGWAFCDGQILAISQNTALFALLGTKYGGDGRSTYALPNMQGNVPINQGQSPGTSSYVVGQRAGTQTFTLMTDHMPQHSHTVESAPANFPGNSDIVGNNAFAKSAQGNAYVAPASFVNMSPFAVSTVGNNQAHNNMMPYLTLNFCIALRGIFPPRS
jgi:microcystin-dependent protein